MFTRVMMLFILAVLAVAPARAQTAITDQTKLVFKAGSTIERMRRDTNIQADMDRLLSRAQAVLIIPNMIKGGFIIGGEHGTGVLLSRKSDGRWSGPAFYAVTSGSVGLQIGLEDVESVYLIMSQGGLNAVMNNRFKAGADAGITLASLGAGGKAATTANAGADIYAYTKAVGVYGGVSLEGSGITPRHSWNAAYYGGNPTPAEILIEGRIDSPHADRLRDLLGR